ncbi:universal stress protein UspA [Haloprofundus marisrubri]|uniref:Universal stress protein UspA n=1 Tax=Haloprofundus marisrubri TaxID=1514971 RepID=A0A0W1R7F5_9EURY|nr:universal stress protein [Haloprofundus marisrubri]KTG09357.1 universal stress protein UspA [Haloprofundus marisrubri]
MKRALVAVTDSERSKRLVREAGELAAGVGGDLVLLAVTAQSSYDDTRQSTVDAGAPGSAYSLGDARSDAEDLAETVANEALAGIDVEYETVGAVGHRADRVLGIANELDCDHIFLAGRRRSPTGKALFGDATQEVLLSFDGPVTVSLGDD